MTGESNGRVVLIFGPNCAGKSTFGRDLAEQMTRSALIEVDDLHHMVVGGLVAWSGGIMPSERPDESKRQCHLALTQAVGLVHSFADAGFASVLTSLDEDCLPASGWARSNFPGFRVSNVVVLCDERTLVHRWKERGWPENQLLEAALDHLGRYRSMTSQFDCVVDTSGGDAHPPAASVAPRLSESSRVIVG